MENLYENVLIGVVSSILTVLLLTFLTNLRSYLRLAKFNGNYTGYLMNNVVQNDRKYLFSFSFWNLFTIRNKIRMKEVVKGKTTWKSIIYINNSNPIISTGCFNYLERYSWGIHKIEMNEESREIFVIAYGRQDNKEYPYILKKK